MTDNRPVLVATEADDLTADMVISELNRRNVPVTRVNPADIGVALTVSARFGSCPVPATGQLHTPSRTVELAEVRSVYWRRPVWPAFDHLSADDARFASAHGMLDWRKDYSALSYRVVDLPDRVEMALLTYLDHFELASGSFDFAVDKVGGLWWLELNPNGQWGWLEESTGLPMSAAFAELLTQGVAP